MKKIVSIALAIALICFMIASTAFANETAVLKVETTTTSVQQGENVVIKISMSSNTTKNIAAIGFNVDVPDSISCAGIWTSRKCSIYKPHRNLWML